MQELRRVFHVSWPKQAIHEKEQCQDQDSENYYLAVPNGMIFIQGTSFCATEANPTFSLQMAETSTELKTEIQLFECRLSKGIWTEERKRAIRKEWYSNAKTAWLAVFPSQPE